MVHANVRPPGIQTRRRGGRDAHSRGWPGRWVQPMACVSLGSRGERTQAIARGRVGTPLPGGKVGRQKAAPYKAGGKGQWRINA